MNEKITVLCVEPNKLPYEKEIENTLEEKQKYVGGYIEYTEIKNQDDVSIICNEEGKIYHLPYNRFTGYDVISGNFLIVGNDYESGEDISLTDEQIQKYKDYFNEVSINETYRIIDKILNNESIDEEYEI